MPSALSVLNGLLPAYLDAGGVSGWAPEVIDLLQKLNDLGFWGVNARGAKCDSTTDDTAAIQATMNALPATGGKVIVPGRARITGPLVAKVPGTRLVGQSLYGSSLITDSSTADFFQADGLAECSVENIQFETKAGVSRTAGSAIHMTGCLDYHLENVRFQDCFNAVTLVDCGTGFLDKLRLVDSGAGNTNRGVFLLGCVSTHLDKFDFNWGTAVLDPFNAGLRIDSACDTVLGDSLIMQGSSGAGRGLYLASSQTVALTAKSGTATISALPNGLLRLVTVSGFSLAAPTVTSLGDMGREITVGSVLPAGTRIGRVISASQAVLTQTATSAASGVACTLLTSGPGGSAPSAFAPRWTQMSKMCVEGSHPPVFGSNSPAGGQPGVVIDDCTSFHWTDGQSASGAEGMVVNKGRDVALTTVRLINNEQHGIDVTASLGPVVDVSTLNCRMSDNSQGQYAGVSQHNIYSGVSIPSGTIYKSTNDYFGDYLVGSARLQKYGIQNGTGSKVYAPLNPTWGNLGTDTIYNKAALLIDLYGLTGAGIARAAAIASPTSDTVGTKAAIDALRAALGAAGVGFTQ